jgi:hypothetical protein
MEQAPISLELTAMNRLSHRLSSAVIFHRDLSPQQNSLTFVTTETTILYHIMIV